MVLQPNFNIKSSGRISKEFLKRSLFTFEEACKYVKELPYGRNADKTNLYTLFTDNCGTCSTKHALLKELADENNFRELKLAIGLFKMNGTNAPPVSATLKHYRLEYIPEAHCYLKYKGQIFDYTKPGSSSLDFINELMEEIEISPNQITEYKVNYHKNKIATWLNNHSFINISLSKMWEIREQCIRDLSQYGNETIK